MGEGSGEVIPAKDKAAVWTPATPWSLVPTGISFCSDQDDPSHSSTKVECLGEGVVHF